MRRDYVTLNLRHTGAGDELPTVELTVNETPDLLDERLVTTEGERIDADGLDVAFRLQTPVDDEDTAGVFSLSNRITGEYVLEVNADATAVLELVDGAREGADGSYRIVVRRDGETVATYEKGMLLVYDDEGNLLRGHSLIPSGVEL